MTATEANPSPTETLATCPLCGTALDPVHPTECPKCDWVLGYRRQQDYVRHVTSGRDVMALILSVVPGAGQFYKGHRMAGVMILACAGLLTLFVVATVSATAGVALVLLPIYWAAVALHAYWAEDLDPHYARPEPATAIPLPSK